MSSLFKTGIPQTWLIMAFNQVANRIEGGALLGLEPPPVDDFHALAFFGASAGNEAYVPDIDEPHLKSLMTRLSDELSVAIHNVRVKNAQPVPVEIPFSGVEMALEYYGFEDLFREVAPNLAP